MFSRRKKGGTPGKADDDSTKFNLASYDGDCLEHIFRRLSPADALHLGLTCRRLLGFFEESRRTTKALALTSFDAKVVPKGVFNIRNINPDASDAVEEEFSSLKVMPFNLPRHSDNEDGGADQWMNYGLVPLTITQKFVDTFPHLRYLEVSSTFRPPDFALLLAQLTPSSLPHLSTLKLCVSFNDHHKEQTAAFFWRPLAQLEHSALRHLTLIVLVKLLQRRAGENGQQQQQQYSIPRLSILQQLITFNFYHEELAVFSQLLAQLSSKLNPSASGARLEPGTGARFGLTLFREYWDVREVAPPEPKLLFSYLTFLDVKIGWDPFLPHIPYRASLVSLYHALPLMTHLQKVELRIGEAGEEPTDYPSFLTALSSLAHLRELSIRCIKNAYYGNGPHIWIPSTLPTLPSVRVLSLKYSTPCHADVAETFQLTHCFPGLRRIRCHFWHETCIYCEYRNAPKSINLPLFQRCGKELTRGLLALQPPKTVLKKELSFTFSSGRYYFKSLEDLLNDH